MNAYVSITFWFVLILSGCVSRNGPYSFFIRDARGFLQGPFIGGSPVDDSCRREVSRLFDAGGKMDLPNPHELEAISLLKTLRVTLDLKNTTPIDFCKALDRQIRGGRRYPPVSLNVALGDSWVSWPDPSPPLPSVTLKLTDVSAYEALASFATVSPGNPTVSINGLSVCVCVHGDGDQRDEWGVVIWESMNPEENRP